MWSDIPAFQGERSEYAERVKGEIRPTRFADLPLDLHAGRERVEDPVDAWLANDWNSSNAAKEI